MALEASARMNFVQPPIEYVLIAQDTPRVECYRRADMWDLQIYQQGDHADFQSLALELAVTDIYEGLFAE